MNKERQVRQAAAFRRYQTFLAEFYHEAKSLRDEDPKDPVNEELVELHNQSAIQLIKSIQKVLKGANRNFLKVVANEIDSAKTGPDV